MMIEKERKRKENRHLIEIRGKKRKKNPRENAKEQDGTN